MVKVKWGLGIIVSRLVILDNKCAKVFRVKSGLGMSENCLRVDWRNSGGYASFSTQQSSSSARQSFSWLHKLELYISFVLANTKLPQNIRRDAWPKKMKSVITINRFKREERRKQQILDLNI
jgi:hypothetical protein